VMATIGLNAKHDLNVSRSEVQGRAHSMDTLVCDVGKTYSN
jgi:hypothetical protein